MFSFIVSTDATGVLGNPWHMHLALKKIFGQTANQVGLEVVATHRALNTLKSHPQLTAHIAGFHSRTHLTLHPNKFIKVINYFIHHPSQILPHTNNSPTRPYILMHNPAYSQLGSTSLQSYVRQYPHFVVENDCNSDSLNQAATISVQLGSKNLIIDWLHFLSQINEPLNWEKLLSILSLYAPQTFAWHISVGTRDNLPLIPSSVLKSASVLAKTHQIKIIIEHQFKNLGLLYTRPHQNSHVLKHLHTQYAYLHTHGLINF